MNKINLVFGMDSSFGYWHRKLQSLAYVLLILGAIVVYKLYSGIPLEPKYWNILALLAVIDLLRVVFYASHAIEELKETINKKEENI